MGFIGSAIKGGLAMKAVRMVKDRIGGGSGKGSRPATRTRPRRGR